MIDGLNGYQTIAEARRAYGGCGDECRREGHRIDGATQTCLVCGLDTDAIEILRLMVRKRRLRRRARHSRPKAVAA